MTNDRKSNIQEEFLTLLTQLRWTFLSLQFGGIEDFLKSSKTVMPLSREAVSKDSITRREDSKKGLAEIRQELGDCRRCRLHETRTHIVFGEGSPEASLVFVGEGPGFEEDQQGRPFVGRAGKLLDKMIRSIGLDRERVYICNVVKCRPPKNRTPDKDEIATCSPFLFKQLEAIHPRIICALGAPAAQTLLGTTESISRLRGKIHYWRGIPLVATFHPAYLLRNPSQKATVWQDLIEVQMTLRSEP